MAKHDLGKPVPLTGTIDETKQLPLETLSQSDAEQDVSAQLAYQNLERRRKLTRRKRTIKIVVGVAVVAIIGVAVSLPKIMESLKHEEELPYTAEVARGTLASDIQVTGTVQAISSTVVTPEVEGIIQNVSVHEGDYVHKGDVLFTLKNDQLDRAVAEAEAGVRSAEDALNSAKRGVDSAYSAYSKAVDAYNAAPEEERAAMTDPDSLYEQVLSAEDAVTSATTSLNTAQASLADAKEVAAKRTVKAPVDGSVVSVGAQNGAAFGAAQGGTGQSSAVPVLIADLTKMKIQAEVNEVDVNALSVGQTAKVTFSAAPDVELDARVERIATVSSSTESAADASFGGGSGVVNYKIELVIDTPDPKIKPGMSANATIQTKNVENVLLVPLGALIDEGDNHYSVTVVTLDEKGQIATSENKVVTVVDKNSTDAAIEGVGEGELVLIQDEMSAADETADATDTQYR